MVGDRRTAALVAADGTVGWLCLPDYDGAAIFGALLDPGLGGFCRFGPAEAAFGRQRYAPNSATLLTTWASPAGELELSDAMAWPWDERGGADGGEDARVLIRRLRCLRGEVDAVLAVRPRDDFDRAPTVSPLLSGALFDLGAVGLRLWASRPVSLDAAGATTTFRLRAGEEVWCVLATGDDRGTWSAGRAREELARADGYWRRWLDDLAYDGPRREPVRRSALTIHLQSFAPTGTPVAVRTPLLPERGGG